MGQLKLDSFEPKFGDWWPKIKPFFESDEATTIYRSLKEQSRSGISIYPKSENTFRAFSLTPYRYIRCCLFGSDPYPGKYKEGEIHATGLSLDCSNSVKGELQPSLESFWEGVAVDLGIENIEKTPDLSFLAEQGVLLVNRALTIQAQNIGSHQDLWDPFWKFFFEEVMITESGIPAILMGKEAQKLEKYIFKIANPVFKCEHPSAAARNYTIWETKGAFSMVNKMLKENNNYSIMWNKADYIKHLEGIPF